MLMKLLFFLTSVCLILHSFTSAAKSTQEPREQRPNDPLIQVHADLAEATAQFPESPHLNFAVLAEFIDKGGEGQLISYQVTAQSPVPMKFWNSSYLHNDVYLVVQDENSIPPILPNSGSLWLRSARLQKRLRQHITEHGVLLLSGNSTTNGFVSIPADDQISLVSDFLRAEIVKSAPILRLGPYGDFSIYEHEMAHFHRFVDGIMPTTSQQVKEFYREEFPQFSSKVFSCVEESHAYQIQWQAINQVDSSSGPFFLSQSIEGAVEKKISEVNYPEFRKGKKVEMIKKARMHCENAREYLGKDDIDQEFKNKLNNFLEKKMPKEGLFSYSSLIEN